VCDQPPRDKKSIEAAAQRPPHYGFNRAGIPEELQHLWRWVLWSWVRKGRWTKMPFDAGNGWAAKSDNKATWAGFLPCLFCASDSPGKYSGVGFVFTEDGGFVGIDLDDCRNPETGEIAPWAKEIIDRLNTYTEVSPSRTGVKLIVRAMRPAAAADKCKEKRGNVELFYFHCYFALTGNRIEGTPATVEARQAELDMLHAEKFPPATPMPAVAPRLPSRPLDLSDQQLLDKARAANNGVKFRSLFDHGCVSAYFSHSEADSALCCLLAYWCDRDEARIDRLFRSSALMRPKWEDRADYRKQTIEGACNLILVTYAEHVTRRDEERARKEREREAARLARERAECEAAMEAAYEAEKQEEAAQTGKKKRGEHPFLQPRMPTVRKPHQRCPFPKHGLFEKVVDRPPAPALPTDHLLTYGCGHPDLCGPCGSFDRDRRYEDFVYALDEEAKGILAPCLCYFETDDPREWRNFQARQRTTAKRLKEHMRRWVATTVGEDGRKFYRVVTPLGDRQAKEISRPAAEQLVRGACDEVHTDGGGGDGPPGRKTVCGLKGAWMIAKPARKYEKITNAPSDQTAVLKFLQDQRVDYEVRLCVLGTLICNKTIWYPSERVREQVRWFIHLLWLDEVLGAGGIAQSDSKATDYDTGGARRPPGRPRKGRKRRDAG
jgi:hypothetical protein